MQNVITLGEVAGLGSFVFVLFLLSRMVRYVGNNRVAIVEKLWSQSGSVTAGLIALNGEAGYQPEVLRGPADLREAVTQGRGAFGPQADAALERIARLRLNMGETAVAAMARDLAAMVLAGRAALGGQDDAAMRAMTASAIERIAGEMEAHAGQGAQAARDRAQAMAGYVAQRYGQDEI